MNLRYWQVDAFADRAGEGNPAGVVLIDDPLEAPVMHAIAAETALPATAFVTADRAIHWFSPSGPIGLCGHGTLAAGHVLLGLDGSASVHFRAPDGRALKVRAVGDDRHELALPAIPTERRDLPELAEFLRRTPLETRFHPDGYALAVFHDAAEVGALLPDFAALRGLGWQVTATAPAQAGVVSRVFTRAGGEDAATGSAHAVLTPYWAARFGTDNFTARQASSRGATFGCTLEGELVRLAGGCVTVMEGTLYWPG